MHCLNPVCPACGAQLLADGECAAGHESVFHFSFDQSYVTKSEEVARLLQSRGRTLHTAGRGSARTFVVYETDIIPASVESIVTTQASVAAEDLAIKEQFNKRWEEARSVLAEKQLAREQEESLKKARDAESASLIQQAILDAEEAELRAAELRKSHPFGRMINLLKLYFSSLSRSYEGHFVNVDARYLHHVFGGSIWMAPHQLRMLQHNTPTCAGERILAFVDESHHVAHPPFFGTHGFYFDAGAGNGDTPRIKGFLSYRQLASGGTYSAENGRVKIHDLYLSDNALGFSADGIAFTLNELSDILRKFFTHENWLPDILRKFFKHENWLPDCEIWQDYLYDDRKRWTLDAFSVEELIHEIRTDPKRVLDLPDIEVLQGRDPKSIIGAALRIRRRAFGDPTKFGTYVSRGYPVLFRQKGSHE